MKEATQDLKLVIRGQEVTIPKEDYYFTEDGEVPVIRHAPLKRLAKQFGVRVTRTILEFPPVVTPDGIYVAHRAFGVDEDGVETSAVGEANPYNLEAGIASQYPVIMSNKRAEDRLLIALLGLEGKVYSESEIPQTAVSEPEEELKFTFGKYAGKTPREVLESGPDGKQYLQWFANTFEAKNSKQKKLQDITRKLLSA